MQFWIQTACTSDKERQRHEIPLQFIRCVVFLSMEQWYSLCSSEALLALVYWSLALKNISSILHLLAESTHFCFNLQMQILSRWNDIGSSSGCCSVITVLLLSSLWYPALKILVVSLKLPTLAYRNCAVYHWAHELCNCDSYCPAPDFSACFVSSAAVTFS